MKLLKKVLKNTRVDGGIVNSPPKRGGNPWLPNLVKKYMPEGLNKIQKFTGIEWSKKWAAIRANK